MPERVRTNSLPRTRRILLTKDFGVVYRGGRSAAEEFFVVYAFPNGRDTSRLGLSVGRRAGGAVQRNRIKRRIREAFRTASDLPSGFDLVVIARKGSCNIPSAAVKSTVVGLVLRACSRWEK
jgi:ribonuclease P protein component